MKRTLEFPGIACLVVLLAGCAMSARQADDTLIDAGFQKVPADTGEWAAALKKLPSHRFAHRTVNGQAMVFYADPVACRCVYAGTQAAYATYKQLHSAEAAAFDEQVGGPSGMAG